MMGLPFLLVTAALLLLQLLVGNASAQSSSSQTYRWFCDLGSQPIVKLYLDEATGEYVLPADPAGDDGVTAPTELPSSLFEGMEEPESMDNATETANSSIWKTAAAEASIPWARPEAYPDPKASSGAETNVSW